MKLLEIPGEKVTAASAAFAVQRLCQLRSVSGGDDGESFVRKAVMHELCETITSGISQLNNETLISLAGCTALSTSGCDEQFIELVNEEVDFSLNISEFLLANFVTSDDSQNCCL